MRLAPDTYGNRNAPRVMKSYNYKIRFREDDMHKVNRCVPCTLGSMRYFIVGLPFPESNTTSVVVTQRGCEYQLAARVRPLLQDCVNKGIARAPSRLYAKSYNRM